MENLKRFCAKVFARHIMSLLTGVRAREEPDRKGAGRRRAARYLPRRGRRVRVKVGRTELKCAPLPRSSMRSESAFSTSTDRKVRGMQSSGSRTAAPARAIGTFLTLVGDRPEGKCFVVATCNDYTSSREFLRRAMGRNVFVDCPSVWRSRDPEDPLRRRQGSRRSTAPPDLTGWTGAEIATLCRTAVMPVR